MGKATLYCEKCGDMIPEKDFESGRAVTVQGKHYCPKCKKAVEHLLPPSGGPTTPVPLSKRSSGIVPAVRPASHNPKSSGIVRAVNPPSAPRTPKHQTLRSSSPGPTIHKKSSGFRLAVESDIPSSDEDGNGEEGGGRPVRAPASRKKAEKKTALYAAIAGGVVLLLAVGFIWNKTSKENAQRLAAEAKAKAADDAWQSIMDLRRTLPDKPEEVLGRLVDKKNALAGSKYEADSKSLDKTLRGEIAEQKRLADLRRKVEDIQSRRETGDIQSLLQELAVLNKTERLPDDLKTKIAAEEKALARLEMQRRLDTAEAFESGNLKKYDEAIDKYTDIYSDCEAPELQEIGTRAKAKADAVTARRESDANSQFEEIRRRVDGLLANHQYEEADKATKEFDSLTFGRTPAKGKIEQLQDRISKEKQEYARSQQPPPPPNPPPDGTPPGGTPAGQAVALFNGKDMGGWNIQGNTVEWKIESGEMVGRSKSDKIPPAGTSTIDNTCHPAGHMNAEYEMEVEVSVPKGSACLLVHFDPGEQKLTTLTFDSTTSQALGPGKWITARIRVEKRVATLFVNGRQEQQINLSPEAPANGTIGFSVNGGSELRVKKATVALLK